MLKVIFINVFSILITMGLNAQETKFESVKRVFTDNSEFAIKTSSGYFKLKNLYSNGSEWKLEGETVNYIIKQAYQNDLSEWKIYEEGKLQTTMYFKTPFTNNYFEWRTGDDPSHFFYIKSVFNNDYNDWKCTTAQKGSFSIKTVYSNDFKEWKIVDGLEASEKIKLSLIFAPIITSISGL